MQIQDCTLTTPNTGIQLHYRAWGAESTPPLVLVHGLASTSRIWDLVAPILAEKYFVSAYDQRGHALSEKPERGYDLPTMLADLVGFIDALHLEKPIVVGHSWGANLALAYAASYPDRCAGLALVDGGVHDFQDIPGVTWEQIKRDLTPPDLSSYKLSDLVNRIQSGVLSNLPKSFIEDYAGSIMSVQPDGTIRARLTLAHHLDILRTIYDMRSHDLLADVKCPVLVVQAVEGGPKNERAAQFLRLKKQGAELVLKLLPQAKIIWMENTIHDIPLHRPERLAREILRFFAGGSVTKA